MPSALADALFQRLINAFPPNHVYPAPAFEQEPMPPSVAHFLGRLLHRRLQHEASSLALPRSSWFNAGQAAVQQARQAWEEVLVAHGHFPSEEWEAALQQATKQISGYLIHPTATLVAFVFPESDETASADTIDRRLGYFSNYRYLPDTVRLYMEQKGVPELTRARFADLLRQIDRQMTDDFNADDWIKLIAPLFALARYAQPERSGVSVEMLRAFFEDKDAEVFVQRLDMARKQGAMMLDKDGLRALLEDEPASVPLPQRERPASPAARSEPAAQASSPDGPVPLWKQYRQQESQQSLAEQVATPPVQAAPARRPAPAQEVVPRWQQFRSENSPAEPPPAVAPSRLAQAAAPISATRLADFATVEQAVLGTTGIHNRDLFIRHLFDGNRQEYEQVLGRIDAAPTWAEASKIIASEVFRKNQVNIYSDPAVLFTDAVEARFGA